VLDGECDSAPLATMEEAAALLARGSAQKRRSATAMNEFSTRAHAVIVLSLTQRVQSAAAATAAASDIMPRPGQPPPPPPPPPHREITSKLFLADLGGSEKVSKSHADEGSKPKVMLRVDATAEPLAEGDGASKRGWFDVDGNWVESDGGAGMAGEGWTEHERITWAEYKASRQQLQETVNINSGLFALKRCIDALHRRQKDQEALDLAGGVRPLGTYPVAIP
jgi:hypothetical protein